MKHALAIRFARARTVTRQQAKGVGQRRALPSWKRQRMALPYIQAVNNAGVRLLWDWFLFETRLRRPVLEASSARSRDSTQEFS
jgi:hypothetical protein